MEIKSRIGSNIEYLGEKICVGPVFLVSIYLVDNGTFRVHPDNTDQSQTIKCDDKGIRHELNQE